MTHSATPDHCRLMIEPAPLPGSRNMAIDETLLESAANQEWCTLRWYQWDQPTISLGYFQKNASEDSAENWQDLPRVRRLSGGGAIHSPAAILWPKHRPNSMWPSTSPLLMFWRRMVCRFSFEASHSDRNLNPFSASVVAMRETWFIRDKKFWEAHNAEDAVQLCSTAACYC